MSILPTTDSFPPMPGRTPWHKSPRTVALMLTTLFLLGLPLIAQLMDIPFYIRFATRIMILAIAAVSLDLILGFGGMVSFGHAAFVGLGAYTVGILSYHASSHEPLSLWLFSVAGSESALVVWPIAILVAALAALIIGAIALRTTGLSFIMLTLAFAQMLYFLFVGLQKYGGEEGLRLAKRSSLPGLDLGNRVVFYYLVFAALAACLLFAWRLVNSHFGMVIRGSRQNERRMRAIGFKTYAYKLACFVISGAMAGLSGVLLANNEQFVSTADLDWFRSADLIIMVILGGVGTLFGPVLGVAAWVLLELGLETLTVHWQAILGPILIVIVLFAKQGLLGLLFGRRGGGHG